MGRDEPAPPQLALVENRRSLFPWCRGAQPQELLQHDTLADDSELRTKRPPPRPSLEATGTCSTNSTRRAKPGRPLLTWASRTIDPEIEIIARENGRSSLFRRRTHGETCQQPVLRLRPQTSPAYLAFSRSPGDAVPRAMALPMGATSRRGVVRVSRTGNLVSRAFPVLPAYPPRHPGRIPT